MRDASVSSYLDDPRLAACAIGLEPAWLWNIDGSQAIWANASGAALFNAPTVGALIVRRFEGADRAIQQITRLAASLPPDGAPRLERLNGFGAGLQLQPLICACSRVTLRDRISAILVCGVAPTRPMLSLTERAQRLLDASDEALAAFTPAGDLVYATPQAQQRTASANTLVAIDASGLALDALRQGKTAGNILSGPTSFWRVGRDADVLLVARFDTETQPASPEQPEDIATASAPALAETESARPINDQPQSIGDIAREEAETVALAVANAKNDFAQAARRHPLRFVWQMDAEQNFKLMSDEFIALAGPRTAQRNGASWAEICAALEFDPRQQVANAVATRDTWSGVTLSWPTSTGEHVKVELSGLPIFDRHREFIGYRGFGVCRDLGQVDGVARLRRDEAEGPTTTATPAPEPLSPAPELTRRLLSLVPSSANVVPFPAALPVADSRTPGLNAGDRKAFSDIAQQLSARLKNSARSEKAARDSDQAAPRPTTPSPYGSGIDGRAPAISPEESSAGDLDWLAEQSGGRTLLDQLPLGVLVFRAQSLLYANRGFLDRVGFPTLADFADGGGLDNVLLDAVAARPNDSGVQRISLITADQGQLQTDARLVSVPYRGESAFALVLSGAAPQSGIEAVSAPRTSIRETDRTPEKILQQQLIDIRRRSEKTATEHSEFLAHTSREMRTPLTAIVGFAEAILGERFGPIGNERYREYLNAIRNAGGRILALIDDIGGRQTIEESQHQISVAADTTNVDLNTIVQSCVTELQPDAARARVLVRTSLSRPLPSVAADANAVRQIVLNLMTNSIKLAGAGGQVIISTGGNTTGTVSLRLRDTGIGINEDDLAAAMQQHPNPTTTTGDGPEGRLKLAVAKALVEANRASLKISSRPNDGTLVEVSFREVSPAA